MKNSPNDPKASPLRYYRAVREFDNMLGSYHTQCGSVTARAATTEEKARYDTMCACAKPRRARRSNTD